MGESRTHQTIDKGDTLPTQSKPAAPTSDAWIPENPGDQITGQVIGMDTAWSDVRNNGQGGFYPLYRVQTDDGDVRTIHAFRTVLENEFIKQEVMPGERIRVTFRGVSEPKVKGRSGAWIFTVEVARSKEAQAQQARRMYAQLRAGNNRFSLPDPPAGAEAGITVEDVQMAFGDVSEDDTPPF